MSASAVTICNLALGRLGDQRILDFNEDTPQAVACRLFYDHTRDEILRSHRWNFAIHRQELSRLSDAPMFEWWHAYQLPEDCLRALEVNKVREWSNEGVWAIEGRRLHVNADHCMLKFIRRVKDTSQMDPLFVEALSCKLAQKLAKPLTGSNSLPRELLTEYETITGPRARRANAFEQVRSNHMPASQSNFVMARWGRGR